MGVVEHIIEHEELGVIDKSQADALYAPIAEPLSLHLNQSDPQTTVGTFKFPKVAFSGDASPTKYTIFQTATQIADITYTWPDTPPAIGALLKCVAGGAMSWDPVEYMPLASGWLTSVDQTLLTGNKTGSYNLETTGTIKASRLNAGVAVPTAYLHLTFGTASAGTAPLKIDPGTVLLTPEMGTLEYVDVGGAGVYGDFYLTVKDNATATRHKIVLTEGTTSLTSGRVSYATTGGRLKDDADLTFDGTTLTAGGFTTAGIVQTPTINGGTAANDDITIQGTTSSTRTTSYVNLQPNGGNVGVGTSTPVGPMELYSQTANLYPFYVTASAATDPIPGFVGRSSRGTLASPTSSQNNDFLFVAGGRGFATSAFEGTSTGLIAIRASENHSDTNQGSFLRVELTPNGSTTASRRGVMAISGTGYMQLGDVIDPGYAVAYQVIKTPTGTGGSPQFTRAMRLGPWTTNANDGSYIEFATSTLDNYGPQIGGLRNSDGGGRGDLIIRTGTNVQTERVRVSDGGATTITGTLTTTGTINKVTITAPATSATLTLVTGSSLITAGAYATTLTSTNTTNVTLPTTGTLSTLAGTETLTNKRITKRTGTTASSATPTINTDNVEFYSLTAQAEDITSFTTNLSGTPTEGQTLWIAITGTAARAITWGTSFEASTVALPTTTVTTNRLDVGFVWNTVTSKWRCVASC